MFLTADGHTKHFFSLFYCRYAEDLDMQKWILVVLLLVTTQAWAQLSEVVPRADSLRKILYNNYIGSKDELFESLQNVKDCDDKCLDRKYKTLIYLLELTRRDEKLMDDYITLINIAIDHYYSFQSPTFLTEGLVDMEAYYEKLGDKEALYKVYYTLTDYHYNAFDYSTALQYGKLAFRHIDQNDSTKINESVLNLINTIGLSYFELSNSDSALWYIDKAIDLAQQQKDTLWLGLISGNKGHILLSYGDTLAALELIDLDIQLSQKSALLNSALNSMEKKLMVLVNQKKATEASALVSKMKVLISDPRTDTSLLSNSYISISKYYESIGALEQALNYIQKKDVLVKIKEKVDRNEKSALVNNYFKLRQFERTTREEMRAYSNRLNRWKWVLGLSLFLIVILTGFVMFYSKRNKLLQHIELQNKKLIKAFEEIEEANKLVMIKQNELLEQSDQLVKVNRKLAELDKFRKTMTNMIVHDLKNALYNIIGLSVGNPDRDRMDFINDTAKRMLRMVLNILDIRKFDEAKMKLFRQSVHISELIDQSLENLELSLRNKALKVEINLEREFTLDVDKDLIRRTIENIALNAILHSSGSEKIVFNVFAREKMMVFEVINWGSYIPNDKQQLIFEPFTQIESSKGEIRSTGLGLAFCKMVLQLHEGQIGVDSQPNEPICFWFSLPFYIESEKLETTMNRTFEYQTPIHLSEASVLKMSPQLKELLNYDVYEMSKVLRVLKAFHPLPDSQAMLWKNELEKAVYHCNNERYQELIKPLVELN